MDKKLWLNREIKNKSLYGIETDNYYLNTNNYHVDKIFNELINYSKNNNQKYVDKDDNESNNLVNKDIFSKFVNFCYKNSQK